MNGHPKMLPAQPGINALRIEWIDINAIGNPAREGIDVLGQHSASASIPTPRKLTDDEFDYNQFSNENGDGEIV